MTPHLTWLLLTKRPGNILTAWGNAMREGREWPSNAAIGCTVVNQDEADRDVPILLEAKAKLSPAFAFLSMEPLLGPVDLTALNETDGVGSYRWSALELGAGPWRRLDWVITGGETDQGTHMARPQHPDWFRSLRDQCAAAGVALHHKQNGEWVSGHAPTHWVGIAGGVREVGEGVWATDAGVAKVGKGAAGRMFNIACGERTTLLDVVSALAQIVGRPIEPRHLPARSGDIKHSLADITRARQTLGYTASVSFLEGLKRTVAWTRENGDA